MPRPARPDDLYRLAVPFDPRLSPDGSRVVFTVKRSAVGRDGYRQAIWSAPVDGSEPARQLTLGVRSDGAPRISPDGTTLAFISDRRLYAEEEPDRPTEAKERDDCFQVFLLALDGGEARRLTDLPKGVSEFAWSPDGRTLAILTLVAGRDDRGGPPEARPAREAEARRDAAVRLPVHRPAELPVQRRRASSTTRTSTCGSSTSRPARRGRSSRVRRPRSTRPGRRTAPGSRSPRTGAGTPTSRSGGRSGSWRSPRARSRSSRTAATRSSSTRPGRATGRRSWRSATSGRGSATGPGSGGSRPTDRMRRRAAGPTCWPGASSSRTRR